MKSLKPPFVSMQTHVQDFFEQHLSIERNASRNTVLAYRDSFKQFLNYAATRDAVSVDSLDHSVFDVDSVRSFLRWLQEERNCGARSRNLRLAALKAFARYLGTVAPEHLDRSRRLRELPPAAFEKPQIEYLDIDEIKTLLDACQTARDRALLMLLFNTGARVQELIDLDLEDLQSKPIPLVTLEGKGRKQRTCPIWNRTKRAIEDWLAERGQHPGPLFPNKQGRRLSRSGVTYILKTITNRAGLEPRHAKRVTPHVIRHSTAMNLLKSDVDITTIAAWLGHAQLETTHGYVEIDLRMKQRAMIAADSIPALKKGTYPHGRLVRWLTALERAPTYVQLDQEKPSKHNTFRG